ncbi:glyoxalase III HchA [Allohahella sp. A8]|uniref:glyoxalase III HchA n=1 Tax=Allohahella sp. A8 TaxID=3141461 RepID=UPI003A7FD3EA
MPALVKKVLGIAPVEDENGGYSPSPLALKLATKDKTDYEQSTFPNAQKSGKLKILMLCTEEKYLTMENGKKFSTGNHPVEMLVPMLHFEQAGFEVDIVSPTGKPVQIEMWAMPEKDEAVKSLFQKYEAKFNKPRSLKKFVQSSLKDNSPYIAVFIPGGHGALLGLPDNRDVGKLVQWVADKDKYLLAICHGPAALLAGKADGNSTSFPYKGYKLAAFPDIVDKATPAVGYLPGPMPWYFGEKLKALDVEIVNKLATGTCHRDRKLITGDSPYAANAFGKMAAEALLSEAV